MSSGKPHATRYVRPTLLGVAGVWREQRVLSQVLADALRSQDSFVFFGGPAFPWEHFHIENVGIVTGVALSICFRIEANGALLGRRVRCRSFIALPSRVCACARAVSWTDTINKAVAWCS